MKIDEKWGFINKQGKVIISPIFDYADYFSNEYALVKFNKKFGYINKLGKFVINPKFDVADYFSDEYTRVGIRK